MVDETHISENVRTAVQDWQRKLGHARTASLATGFTVSARSTYGDDWAIRAQSVTLDSNLLLNTSSGIVVLAPTAGSGLAIFAPGLAGRRIFVAGEAGPIPEGAGTELHWSAWGPAGTTPFSTVNWAQGGTTFWFETEIGQPPPGAATVAFQLGNNAQDNLELEIRNVSVMPLV